MDTILLVEDEPIIRMMQTEALTDAGFLVHPAADAASALAIARTVGVSAAIIDMGLPDGRGDTVARELRARSAALPILICTGYDAAALAAVTMDIDVRIIEKPIDDAALIGALREHIMSRQRSTRSAIDPATLTSQLALAESHVAQGREHVAPQREMIEQLLEGGHDTTIPAGGVCAYAGTS